MGGNQQLTLLARGKLSEAAGKVCVFQWLEVFVGMHLPDVCDLQGHGPHPGTKPGYNTWAREKKERCEEKEGEMKNPQCRKDLNEKKVEKLVLCFTNTVL